MKKLEVLDVDYNEVIELCYQKMKDDNPLRDKCEQSKELLNDLKKSYENRAHLGDLHKCVLYEIKKEDEDEKIIVGQLSYSDLKKLYEQYLSKEGQPARNEVYDKIMRVETCVFCDIGLAKDLDHFLPKSKYPQFSILPCNLVPSCVDCNRTEKRVIIPRDKSKQLIHPYFDKSIFFEEQWIRVSLSIDKVQLDNSFFDFYVEPPISWNSYDKEKAKFHFINLGLKEKLEANASNEFSSAIRQAVGLLDALTLEKWNDLYISPVINNPEYYINHWRRILYSELKHYVQNSNLTV